MTDEIKLTIETLRHCEESGARCGNCPSGANEQGIPNCHSQSHIADLLESLSAELERTQRELDGLSIMYTNASSAARTHKRERDEALNMLAEFGSDHPCDEFSTSEYCEKCSYDSPPRVCWLRYIRHRLVEKEN